MRVYQPAERGPERPRRCGAAGVLCAALVVAVLPGCRPPPPPRVAGPQLVQATRLLLGGTVTVTVVARDAADQERAVRLAGQALEEVRRVERAAAAAPRTLEQVHRAAGQVAVPLVEDLFRLLTQALRLAEATGGAYDPTWGPLRALYCEGGKPTPAAVKAQLGLVGHGQVRLTPQPPGFVGTVSLKRAGMRLSLEELWRPYAVDRAAQVLAEAGLGDFLVEADTIAVARGQRPDGPWRIAVEDPAHPGEWLARLFMKDGAMAVAGAAAGAPCGGVIVDPRSGAPAGGVQQVAVLAPDAVSATALARAAAVLGPEGGPALLQRLGRDGIVVRAPAPIWVSEALRGGTVLHATGGPGPDGG